MDVATHILKDDIRVLRNMNKLPIEMIDQILAYEGRFRYRNGILMCQIPKNDPRKIVLSKITQLKYYTKTTTLGVVLFITKYKFFEISNTCTPTHIDMHLRTIFNCGQTGIVLNNEYIHYTLEP